MKKIIIALSLTLISNFLIAQNSLLKQWDKRFGGTKLEMLSSLQQTSDMGFILGGHSISPIGGDKTQDTIGGLDYWLVKIDSLGNKQWDKDFGGNSADLLSQVYQTNDKGYILGGYSKSSISGDKSQSNYGMYDYWIVKIDSLGNKEWDKTYGGTDEDILNDIKQCSDGGYILSGYSYSGANGDKTQPSWGAADFWIIKTDSLGNKEWDKDYGGTSGDGAFSVEPINNGYILFGTSQSGINGDKTQPSRDTTNNSFYRGDFWIVKIDSFGNKVWDKVFGGALRDELFAAKKTNDGGFILSGYSNSGISGDKTQPNRDIVGYTFDYWVIKTDSLVNKEWDKTFGGNSKEGQFKTGGISQTFDQGFLIANCSWSPLSGDKSENNLGGVQTWIVKTDSLGNKLWDKTIFTNGPDDEQGFAIETTQNCYVFANYTGGGIGGYKSQPNWDLMNLTSDFWIIKFCDTTSTTGIIQLATKQLSFSIYPNPADKIITVHLNNNKHILITNLLGENVIEKKISSGPNTELELDISFLSSGIYFIKIDNAVQMFVKE